ncbi:ABC transporter ATP-binding protein [Pseudomonas veronii]|uniref:ABC transporter ATP-binding protein n=1 Tax=Pseudomonas veronii TaxID=76761 RepID=A0ABS0VNZ1_PSEVE|nr:ABC transporter ATP-binding protein [Pseudomonas veronii]MBI6553355.1 ABC transporter ATP-binding protein [Pseudomonas veronii]MBI6653259.1 ABC transporter ATP-binding protein [Pseudomonas veronii]WRU61037.1 ABC transporter ATP-binding protein [Pseudomonas veronii]
MSSDNAITVQNLSKCYQIYAKPHDRLKQSLYPRVQGAFGLQRKQYFKEFWSLRDVSFEIKKGETVGIIGRNGSGKSTLLQVICGTLSQTAGSIQTNGRIAALLELGSGFNPEFTGRENVYMNGAILGLSRQEIEDRFDAIAAFADIGAFLEQPVKTYSSGMFVRLAFACNIMSDPEIMIVDEALSVGDMNFQAKCMTALTKIKERGATILFVSHDVGTVKSLCSRCVYLDGGKVVAVGSSANVTELYVRNMREEMNAEHRKFSRVSKSFAESAELAELQSRLPVGEDKVFKINHAFEARVAQFRYGTGEVKARSVELLDMKDEPTTFLDFNQQVKIRVNFEAYAEKSITLNVSVFDEKKNNIIGCGFQHVDQPYLLTKPGGKYVAEYVFKMPLQEGYYSLRINISSVIVDNESAEFIDLINDAVVFRVARWEKARVWSQVHQFAELRLEELL